MFPCTQNGSQAQQNIEGQRHCVLIAASNPHPLPTPVYRPQIQNLEQSENIDPQTESRLSDAETVAKSFPQVVCSCFLWQCTSANFSCLLYYHLVTDPQFVTVLSISVCYLSKTTAKN